ncbi:sulfurtransferase [Prescottella equi]|uniref:Sulfurtransferase n=1 Tax=Rhodococcus hoagii TaxID=43767 RepID=A0A9Q5EXA4_RHOHA|nr:rhodanese-like domain-containing protein [Prescottella equi]MBM4479119.1 sulfurtransferase [Prescottella equi]MBM4488993.1 sulfurtransferase [Prescottella equi]MBM4498646.1 sulfurtransferase [Prescottella equi]MBM4503296.1 sulfurtransferase [Prescottella equi]MBM4512779.1 sulfurtransferase [Prescottella equi]
MYKLSSVAWPLIQAEELAALLGEESAPVVLDVTVLLAPARFDGDYRPASGVSAWREAHVPGSRHVDLLAVFSDGGSDLHFSRPRVGQLVEDLAGLGITADTDVVLYDQGTTTWAARVWWLLRSIGFHARVLDGGLARWRTLDLPVAVGDDAPVRPAAAPLDVTEYRPAWADRHDAVAIVEGSAPGTLVCALAPAQFSGAEQTRYSRRGHIPGSRNLSAKSLLDETGRLRPVEELRSLASAALAGADDPVVLYCGGGISACLSALGLVLAGHHDIRIYDGSLEEWTADPALPLVTLPGGEP